MHKLSAYFIDPYYSRHEIAYRLPASVPISEFWPEELRFRRSRSVTLPLRTVNSKSFWYVPVGSLLRYENNDRFRHVIRVFDAIAATCQIQASDKEALPNGQS